MVKKKVITKKIKKKIGKNKLKSEKKVKVKSPKKKTDNSSSSTVFLSKENESQLISLITKSIFKHFSFLFFKGM